MFLDTQWQTNGGNGWMQVVEFMKDGESVKIRRTRPTSICTAPIPCANLNFDLTHVDSPLIWNNGADSFSNGFVRGNGSRGRRRYRLAIRTARKEKKI